MKFVIFHGSFGSPEGNWFPQLKESLENIGQEVIVPQLPVEDWDTFTKTGSTTIPKNQNLQNWLKTFEKLVKSFKKGEKLCFVGHSLGPLFILHVIEKYNIKLDSAIFVSPFLEKLGGMWQIDNINASFYKIDFDWKKLNRLIPVSYVLYSDNDPYVPKARSLEFAHKLGSSLVLVRGAAHMNINKIVNLNEFPLVLELCKSRLDLNLYQKYLAHRRELFSVQYIEGKSEEVIYLSPNEVRDEGTFHFRNLNKSGFATFYVKLGTFWDPKSQYMEECRKAAKRVPITRVLILDTANELLKPIAMEQMKLDMPAGIKTYICLRKDIKDVVKELDFGLWDEDYRCFVQFNKKFKVTEVEMSSRKKDLLEAKKWRDYMLKHATQIHNADKDITAFIKSHS